MPRGNTETVYPRALVLATIRRSLDQLDYRRAFELARTHRIDLNLLHDHHPERFFASVDALLDSVPDPERLDLFLSMLKYETWYCVPGDGGNSTHHAHRLVFPFSQTGGRNGDHVPRPEGCPSARPAHRRCKALSDVRHGRGQRQS